MATIVPFERKRVRRAVSLPTHKGANQADGPGADINTIVAQYKRSGTLPNVARRNPLYGDFTFPNDIHAMREAVFQADDRFMELPADIRSAASNDWVKFIEMFNDPDQLKILEAAGLNLTDTPPPNNSPPPPPDPEEAPSPPSPEEP